MACWKNTEYTRPSWGGASIHNNGMRNIVWDGDSRFYAIETSRGRFYTIHFVAGNSPEPRSDVIALPQAVEIHYVGNILMAFKLGYRRGAAPMIDDGK